MIDQTDTQWLLEQLDDRITDARLLAWIFLVSGVFVIALLIFVIPNNSAAWATSLYLSLVAIGASFPNFLHAKMLKQHRRNVEHVGRRQT